MGLNDLLDKKAKENRTKSTKGQKAHNKKANEQKLKTGNSQ